LDFASSLSAPLSPVPAKISRLVLESLKKLAHNGIRYFKPPLTARRNASTGRKSPFPLGGMLPPGGNPLFLSAERFRRPEILFSSRRNAFADRKSSFPLGGMPSPAGNPLSLSAECFRRPEILFSSRRNAFADRKSAFH
jgi:hypothetical protein